MKARWILLVLFLTWGAIAYGDDSEIQFLKKQAAAVRGLSFKEDIKVDSKTKDELQKYVVKMLETEMPNEKLFEMKKTLEAFGLISKRQDLRKIMIDFYTNNIGGFYDPATKQLYIIKGSMDSAAGNQVVIVHELIHALQDQHFDLFALQKYIKTNDDQSSALSGLVEGDATLGMFSGQMAGNEAQQRNFVQFFKLSTDLSKEFIPTNQKVPGIIQDSMFFNYTEGLEFNWKLKNQHKMEGVNKAFTNLPASTEQILHPEKYMSGDDPWEIEIPSLDGIFAPADGWHKVYENTMGELGIQIMLREHLTYKNLSRKLGKAWDSASKNIYVRGVGRILAKLWTASKINGAAAGWGGDHYQVYYNKKTDRLSLVWYTLWDSERDAKEFASAYREVLRMRGARPSKEYTSSVVQKDKTVIILKDVPVKSTVLLLQKLESSKATLFDRSKFASEFPICRTVYALRFVKPEETAKKQELQKKITEYGKKAVPFLVEALDGETKQDFSKEVEALLKSITKQNFGTDYKKWKEWSTQNK